MQSGMQQQQCSSVKVSKSQKPFFLKLYCLKNKRNTFTLLHKAEFCGRILSNILFVFRAMEFQEKMLLRFTDLYTAALLLLHSRLHFAFSGFSPTSLQKFLHFYSFCFNQITPSFSWSIYIISRLILHLRATYNYSKMYLIL